MKLVTRTATGGAVVTAVLIAGGLALATGAGGAPAPESPTAGRTATPATSRAARKNTTCRSGKTRYARDGVRIFELDRTDEDRLPYTLFLACRPGSKQRVLLYASSHGGTTVEWVAARAQKPRVIWQVEEFADGGGAVTVGWFDVRDGTHRDGDVTWQFGRPVAATVAADGAIVVAARNSTPDVDTIGYMALARKRLKQPRALATVPGGIVPSSLVVQGGTVSWTTKAGAPGSAPIG